MSLLNFFKEVEIFSCFNDHELQTLEDSCKKQTVEFGEVILDSGEQSEGLYLIQKGRARLFINENGKEKSLGLCKVGDTFFEATLLQNSPTEYSVRSSGTTELLIFPKAVFQELLSKNENANRFVNQYIALKYLGGLVAEFFNLKKIK